MFRGRGGRFPRMPPSRWSGGGGGLNHPYRGPPDHRPGGGHGFRTVPGEFDRGFHGCSRDDYGGIFAKLFVGAVPRTATEEEIRPLFEEHGKVIEVAFMKDRRTGQQQTCCFVKYAAVDDAERAIGALHNQYTLPGGSGPIQVRYAEGERERLGDEHVNEEATQCEQSEFPLENTEFWASRLSRRVLYNCAFKYKLFVASINKQATERDIEEIFTPYGRVEDIFLLRDEMNQNRGCCFVKLTNREMAEAAINALHGTYVMSGCDQPLIVRFADPKKPRPGEFRGGHTFGGPGFRPRFQGATALRHTPNHIEPFDGDMMSNTSRPISPQCFGPSSEDTMDAPADLSNTLSSSQQVHQLEQFENPLSVCATVGSQSVQSQGGQPSESVSPIQQNIFVDATHIPLRLHEQGTSAAADEQQLPISTISQQLLQPPLRRSPSYLTESQWNGRRQSAVSTPSSAPPSAISSMASIAKIPLAMRPAFHILCNWSEHTCPDGFKYYYNCITHESVWEKPKEYANYERERQHKMQQQQKPPNSPPQPHLHSQIQSVQASQLQQAQHHVQSVR